jgi:hypothetical protein
VPIRYDSGFDLKPSHRSREGYIYAEGFIAKPGVLVYERADGTKIRELVTADTLRRDAGSLGRKPVTLEHPPIPVDPDNVHQFSVGEFGHEIEVTEGGYVKVSLAVKRRDGIDAVDRGDARELSPGYKVELDETPGTHPFYGPYDREQIRRYYNHGALTGKARAGQTIRLRADSDDAKLVGYESFEPDDTGRKPASNDNPNRNDSPKKNGVRVMPHVRLDDYTTIDIDDAGTATAINQFRKDMEGEKAELADALKAAKEKIGEFRSEVDELQKQRDELQKQIDGKQGQLDALKASLEPGGGEAGGEGEGGEEGAGLDSGKGDEDDEMKGDSRADAEQTALDYYNERQELVGLAQRMRVDGIKKKKNGELKRAIVEAFTGKTRADASEEMLDGSLEIIREKYGERDDSYDNASRAVTSNRQDGGTRRGDGEARAQSSYLDSLTGGSGGGRGGRRGDSRRGGQPDAAVMELAEALTNVVRSR